MSECLTRMVAEELMSTGKEIAMNSAKWVMSWGFKSGLTDKQLNVFLTFLSQILTVLQLSNNTHIYYLFKQIVNLKDKLWSSTNVDNFLYLDLLNQRFHLATSFSPWTINLTTSFLICYYKMKTVQKKKIHRRLREYSLFVLIIYTVGTTTSFGCWTKPTTLTHI